MVGLLRHTPHRLPCLRALSFCTHLAACHAGAWRCKGVGLGSAWSGAIADARIMTPFARIGHPARLLSPGSTGIGRGRETANISLLTEERCQCESIRPAQRRGHSALHSGEATSSAGRIFLLFCRDEMIRRLLFVVAALAVALPTPALTLTVDPVAGTPGGEPIEVLWNRGMYDQCIEACDSVLSSAEPGSEAMASALFTKMLCLRKLNRYEQARTAANNIVTSCPNTSLASRMGGSRGRTEDEAAFAYADALKAYHNKDYGLAWRLFMDFLADFPNNWRVETARFYQTRILYDLGLDDKFLEESQKAITENPGLSWAFEARYLRACILTRKNSGLEARSILAGLASHPKSDKHVPIIRQSLLETYLHTDALAQVTRSDATLRKEAQALLRECFDHAVATGNAGWLRKCIAMSYRLHHPASLDEHEALLRSPDYSAVPVESRYVLVDEITRYWADKSDYSNVIGMLSEEVKRPFYDHARKRVLAGRLYDALLAVGHEQEAENVRILYSVFPIIRQTQTTKTLGRGE